MRHLLAVAAGVAVAVVGALILGEYELRGPMAVIAGVLFGLAVAEAIAAVARDAAPRYSLVAAGLAAAGFVWAAWIAAGRVWGFVPGLRWVAAAVAAVAAALWLRSSGRREAGSPDEPSRTPVE